MRKTLFVAVVLAISTGSAWASLSWNYDYADGDGTSLTSPYSWATVDTFGPGPRPGWTYTGNFTILTGDVSGKASAPWSELDLTKDNTPYLSVPLDNQIGSAPLFATVDFNGGEYNYLGLHWGSMDRYNMIEFLSDGSVVESIGGADVWIGVGPAAPGGQSVPNTNQYVNIFSTSPFDAVRIVSTTGSYAFELDNLAVPVPGAVLLGMLGLSVVGVKLRKHV